MSRDLDAVRAALDPWEPRSRREVAKLAGVTNDLAVKAVGALVVVGEARYLGRHQSGSRNPLELYARWVDPTAGGTTEPELPDPRSTLVHLLVRRGDLLLDDAGRPIVANLRPVADLVALHFDHLGVEGVSVRSAPVGSLGALFDEAGLGADDLVLLEATTSDPDDLTAWAREITDRTAGRIRRGANGD